MAPPESRRLVAGAGRYLDDIAAGGLEAAFLRSPYPHARIVGIDVSRAAAAPGVRAVLTGREVRDLVAGPQPVVWRAVPDQHFPQTYPMAVDKVLYVGHPVVAVAAIDRFAAEDALELIDVEYEPLAHVVDIDAARAADAPLLYPEWGTNVSGRTTFAKGEAAAALAASDVVVRETFSCGRGNGVPLEGRGCIATWERLTDSLDIWISAQSPFQTRECLAEVLGLSQSAIRVRTPDLGGGFGNKHDFYGEEVVISLLSKVSGRTVKWTEDRRESFVANAHSGEVRIEIELGARSDGTLTAMRATVTGTLGGTLGYVGMGPVWMTGRRILGPYRIPDVEITVVGVMTNKSPFGSFRGWGQTQANFACERLLDRLSRELDIPPDRLRTMNFPEPDEFPYYSAFNRFDSGRYAECLQLVTAEIDRRDWPRRRAEGAGPGRSIGYGIASYVEGTGLGQSRLLNMGGLKQTALDSVRIEIDSSGSATVYSAHTSMGQNIESTLRIMCADSLGLRFEDIRVVLGDTGSTTYTGYGTAASRAATVGGAVVKLAAEKLRALVLEIAAEIIDADPTDLTIQDSQVCRIGESVPSVSVSEVARACYQDLTAASPKATARTLVVTEYFDPPAVAIAYGTVACLAEVDRQTGAVTLLDYIAGHDCGTVINPLVVDGQVVGGTAQALGLTLWEEIVYDSDGGIVTTSFMDYLLPSFAEIPPCTVLHLQTPSPHIPGGMKGVGEGGMIPAPAAVASAVDDALRDLGVYVRQIPLSPERVLGLIRRPAEVSG